MTLLIGVCMSLIKEVCLWGLTMNSPKCGKFTQGKRRECEEGLKGELIVS